MSAYQMVVSAAYRRAARTPRQWRARFWTWWIGLYAEPPRKLPPMI